MNTMALPTTEDLAFNFAMASDHSSSDEGTAAASPFVATPPDAGPSECNGKELQALAGLLC